MTYCRVLKQVKHKLRRLCDLDGKVLSAGCRIQHLVRRPPQDLPDRTYERSFRRREKQCAAVENLPWRTKTMWTPPVSSSVRVCGGRSDVSALRCSRTSLKACGPVCRRGLSSVHTHWEGENVTLTRTTMLPRPILRDTISPYLRAH